MTEGSFARIEAIESNLSSAGSSRRGKEVLRLSKGLPAPILSLWQPANTSSSFKGARGGRQATKRQQHLEKSAAAHLTCFIFLIFASEGGEETYTKLALLQIFLPHDLVQGESLSLLPPPFCAVKMKEEEEEEKWLGGNEFFLP